MSEASLDLLVVGSGLEAQLALAKLSEIQFGGTLHHLPTVVPESERFEFADGSRLKKEPRAPAKARLVDIWGKSVLTLKLPAISVYRSSRFSPPDSVKSLAQGLRVSRTAKSDRGILVTLSDGSELLCQGVVFADGLESQAKRLWDKPARLKRDPGTVKVWSFVTADLIDTKVWEFRWAPAKSVELVPLPDSELLVKLRFKSPHGGDLTVSELEALFSEFGSDMTALFENLGQESVASHEEKTLAESVFSPAAGCLALGRAAWATNPMLTLGWLGRLVDRQLNILADQLRVQSLNPESFEAQCRECLEEFSECEQFVRKQLHNDSALLRPIRNLILSLVPNSILVGKLKGRLYL